MICREISRAETDSSSAAAATVETFPRVPSAAGRHRCRRRVHRVRHAGDRVDVLVHLGHEPDLGRSQRPRHHGGGIGAVDLHRRQPQLERVVAQLDAGRVRQVLAVGEQAALMRRVLVEHVDRAADQLVDLDRHRVLDLAQRPQRRLVGVGDLEGRNVGEHDVDRHVVQHRPPDRRGRVVGLAGSTTARRAKSCIFQLPSQGRARPVTRHRRTMSVNREQTVSAAPRIDAGRRSWQARFAAGQESDDAAVRSHRPGGDRHRRQWRHRPRHGPGPGGGGRDRGRGRPQRREEARPR